MYWDKAGEMGLFACPFHTLADLRVMSAKLVFISFTCREVTKI